MLPKPVRPLTKTQWSAIEADMKRKPSAKDIERVKRVKENFKNYDI